MAVYRIRLAPVAVLSESGPQLIEEAKTVEIVGDVMGLYAAIEGDYYQIKRKGAVVFLCAASLVSYCQELVTQEAQVLSIATEEVIRG
jgi:hypothetical protein